MLRTDRKVLPRVGIRIPKPMTDEISRIIKEYPGLYNNRQQFIESAIRQEIIRIKQVTSPRKQHVQKRKGEKWLFQTTRQK